LVVWFKNKILRTENENHITGMRNVPSGVLLRPQSIDWFLESQTWTKSFMASICSEIRFEDAVSSCDGFAEKVTYEIRDGEVLVHGALGLITIYKVQDKNTISFKMQGMGEATFNRTSY